MPGPGALGLLVGGRERVRTAGGRVDGGEDPEDRAADGEYPGHDVDDRVTKSIPLAQGTCQLDSLVFPFP